MSERFEEYHRTLRANPEDAENNINTKLWTFEMCTGPFVDDLVAAVRPVFDVFDPEDDKMSMEQYTALRKLFDALSALDKEANGA